jgi:hypothetical protein
MASIKLLKPHVPLLRKLGVEGMSSDEEDEPTGSTPESLQGHGNVYRVLTPRWRAKDLTAFLHVVDSVHLLQRRTDVGRQRGNWPRTRIHDPSNLKLSEKTEFPKSLPRNAYNSRWLETFPNIAMSVNPDPEYNLTHPPEVFQ